VVTHRRGYTIDRGTPAIQPRSDSIPSFTEHDVRDYLSRGVSLGKIRVLGQPEAAGSITWELDWEAWGRLARTAARRPDVQVRLAGTALATVTRNRLSDVTIHALDAMRVEQARPTSGPEMLAVRKHRRVS
jgi:hypothetical protein